MIISLIKYSFISQIFAFSVYFLVTSLAQAQSSKAVCALFVGDKIIEKSECKITVVTSNDNMGDGGSLSNYQWANGRVTITNNLDEWFTINGIEGGLTLVKEGYDICVDNVKDEKLFCVTNDLVNKKSYSLGSYNWAAKAACETDLGYAVQTYSGSDCLEKMKQCFIEPQGDEACFSPDLCRYLRGGELISSGECVSIGITRHNYAASYWLWENGNVISIHHPLDGASEWSDQQVKELTNNDGYDCYHITSTNERFCSKANPISASQ